MYSVQDWIRYGAELRRPLVMMPGFDSAERVLVVGGGLSGLTLAYRIGKVRPDLRVDLVEKCGGFGGVIGRWKEDDWLCDLAVNASRPHPAVWRLIEELELKHEFQASNPLAKKRWVYLEGKRHEVGMKSALKMGFVKLLVSLIRSRSGGRSVADVIPHRQIADALTLGIVNDTADRVDADFLFPALTRFGPQPPKRTAWIRKKMQESYPLFTPVRGSLASLEGGMTTMIERLVTKLEQMPNVHLRLNTTLASPTVAAAEFDLPLSSVIWTAPLDESRPTTSLSIFAVGYRSEDVAAVPVGYGTLVPDSNMPISGILHESDVHLSARAPNGHRLFRLMVPHSRWGGDVAEVKKCVRELISIAEPVLFRQIAERKIPRYPPGHLARIARDIRKVNRAGWGTSGVSITHIACEAERFAAALNPAI